MHPLGLGGARKQGVAGASFWAVSTYHCLIGQRSGLSLAPALTPQCRAEARVVFLLLDFDPVWQCSSFVYSSTITYLELALIRLDFTRSHECAGACHLYPPTNTAHSSGLTGAR